MVLAAQSPPQPPPHVAGKAKNLLSPRPPQVYKEVSTTILDFNNNVKLEITP